MPKRLIQEENVSDTLEPTPVKIKCCVCVVCNKKNAYPRRVNSAAGIRKKLRELLKIYGEIDVIQGSLCRSCEKKLFNLHRQTIQFRDLCQSSYYSANVNRCSTSPVQVLSQPETHLSACEMRFMGASGDENMVDEQSSSVATIQPMENIPFGDTNVIKTVAQLIVKSLAVDDYCLTKTDCGEIVHATNTKVLSYLVDTISKLKCGKQAIQQKLIALNDEKIDTMRKLKKSASVMLHTDRKSVYETLVNFSWESCVKEFYENFPSLCSLIVGMMLPREERCNETDVVSLFPKLGLIYGIIVQRRIPYLSRVQRMMSATLMDSMLGVKGFDRLEATGICLSYNRAQLLIDAIRGDFDATVIEAVRSGKKIRIVGDTVDMTLECKDERTDRHKKMLHFFGSAVIIHDLNFPEANRGTSQMDYQSLRASDLLPNMLDVANLVDDYAHMMMHVAIKHLAYFKFLEGLIPIHIIDENSEQLKSKTVVVPLSVVAKNEEKYKGVVDILRHYETTMSSIYEKAGTSFSDKTIHIGGNQLTREDFSGAKRLMIGESAANRFEHLTPITTEFHHMAIELLCVVFKHLYKASSVRERGTMKAMQTRLQRTTVTPNVSEAYSANENFVISLTDAHIIEAVLHYFEMDDMLSSPTKITAPQETEERLEWAHKHFKRIVEKSVGTFIHRHKTGVDSIISGTYIDNAEEIGAETEPDQPSMTVMMHNAIDSNLVIQASDSSSSSKNGTDKVEAYAQLFLELGLLFKNFTESIKVPNRPRMLRTLKLMMIVLKADDDLSKNADEVLRFLVHQTCTLSEYDAKLTFYSMFINTRGCIDSHIAADMQMASMMKTYKKHIKLMLSNNTETNIERKTTALGSLLNVSTHYDNITSVVARLRGHGKPSEIGDEISMLEDLRQIHPFKHIDNRSHNAFKNIQLSLLDGLDREHIFEWLMHQSRIHATSPGN